MTTGTTLTHPKTVDTDRFYSIAPNASAREREEARGVSTWLILRMHIPEVILSCEYEVGYLPWCEEYGYPAVGKGRWSRVLSGLFGPSKTMEVDGETKRARSIAHFVYGDVYEKEVGIEKRRLRG